MSEENTSTDTYVLGRTREETRRLEMQAHFMNPSTRRMFELAGIRRGMKVLDLGSGAGDVALLLADLVGPDGTVTGVDMNPVILETARARMHTAGLVNVTFLVGNIETFQFEGEFDAIVGRLVLAHFRDPALALRRLARHLRPGGIMAFQEPDLSRVTTANSHPPCRRWDQACNWIAAAYRYGGLATSMGLDLYKVLLDAGLLAPQLLCEAVLIGAGPDWIGYEQYAQTVRSLLPLILKSGVATVEEVAIDTLAEQLRAEAVSQQSVLRGPELISAWTYKAPLADA